MHKWLHAHYVAWYCIFSHNTVNYKVTYSKLRIGMHRLQFTKGANCYNNRMAIAAPDSYGFPTSYGVQACHH